ILLSGYENTFYRALEDAGWIREMRLRESQAFGPRAARCKNRKRWECLWLNPALQRALDYRRQGILSV
ncbi:MAG: hypothetical protein ONB06_05810, partial [candidate division KSB1 bacterium]|nr:hypothetical protein [candidate division KSB1 bacterium]